MEKFYDLTDFEVLASDGGESYAVFEKWFNTGDDALEFCCEMQNEIAEKINEGKVKFYSVKSYYPFAFGYLPLVAFKLPNCEGYDEDGICEEEGGSDFEIMGCIADCKSYPNGRVEITVLFAMHSEFLDESDNKNINVYGLNF